MNSQQNSVSENNFEQYIKCTICTVYCPVAAVNPLYPGPKQAGPDGERLRLKRKDFYDEALKYCLNCKRCEVACPSNVRIGDIIQSAKIRYSKKKPSLRDIMLANTDIVGRAASAFAPVVNGTLSLKPVKTIMDTVISVDKRRSFPKYASHTFESMYRKIKDSQDTYNEKVAFFHGCNVNYNAPELGMALVRIMNSLGIGVELLEKEKCCGIAGTYGFKKEYYEASQAIGESLFKQIEASGADIVATDCETCKWQIEMSTSKKCEHPLSIIAEYLDFQ